ncbi:MAG TPA: 2-succinyl-5-enolpyruvyl-6-hydroxy-3-cyclohexene-1-carboxylic-acid synthase [Candidatus Didemnitutus sp.]|nr:2-succinyl-5-enolpyruvyl-6-hydroxy-3-cyclohexene-1-carboxylic-acid synthase [Candidatus Didemnitutus sp.]
MSKKPNSGTQTVSSDEGSAWLAASDLPPHELDFRNVNSLWASVLVETLVQLGVRRVVISPGSRSAPLTFAFARHPRIEAIPVLDERSAGFLALGLAKQRLRPVALVCTSGTAAANYLPAVVEAHESGVPLLIFTADRPPEMRDCHSGQAIDQLRLYGRYVRFFHEFAVPEANLAMLRYVRQTVVHAHAMSVRPSRGPVHCNCPFRDPLPPLSENPSLAIGPGSFKGFFSGIGDYQPSVGSVTLPLHGPLWPKVAPGERGVIVVGPNDPPVPDAFGQNVGRISRALGWTVLADALSPARHHPQAGHVVAHYDAILRQEKLAQDLRPDRVICIGGWPTSKVLRTWLQAADPMVVLLSDGSDNQDALHLRTGQVSSSLSSWSAGFSGERAPGAYGRRWLDAERRVKRTLSSALARTRGLVEPACVAEMARHLPAGTGVFAASSMPVRDLEYFWPANDRRFRIQFNRGANGIDGTLSTALGVAHGAHQPTVLLTGDLALLHDTNGFLTVPRFRGSLTIVLINNRGGGIFEHLPVAQFEPPFEEFFATPQDVDFATLCRAHGVPHVRVRSRTQLAGLLRRLPKKGLRVLEVNTDRKRDAAFRKDLLARAASAVTARRAAGS